MRLSLLSVGARQMQSDAIPSNPSPVAANRYEEVLPLTKVQPVTVVSRLP